MTNPTYEINKAAEDALTSLTKLNQTITSSRGEDVDYRPNETTQKAYAAVERFLKVLNSAEGVKEFRGRGNLLDVIAIIGPKLDSPSVQTMLGSSIAMELLGMLRTTQLKLKDEKDSRKVEGTGFDALKKR